MSAHRYFIQAIEKPGNCLSPGGWSVKKRCSDRTGYSAQMLRQDWGLKSSLYSVFPPHPTPGVPLVFLHSQGFIPLLWFNGIPSLSVLRGFLFLGNNHGFACLVPPTSPQAVCPFSSWPSNAPLGCYRCPLPAALDWSKSGHLTQAGPMRAESFKRPKLWSAGWSSHWRPSTLEKD